MSGPVDRGAIDIVARRRRVSLATHDAREDGDFVELRKLRDQFQQMRMKEETKLAVNLFNEKSAQDIQQTNNEQNGTHNKKLLDDLFTAIANMNKEQVNGHFYRAKKLLPLDQIRKPDTKETVLHAAIQNGMIDFAKSLIASESASYVKASYIIRFGTEEGPRTALHIATEKGDLNLAETILKKIGNSTQQLHYLEQATAIQIKGQRPRKLPCLHLAAYHGHRKLVARYLDLGVDVNLVNGKKDTALLWAARWAHDDVIELLLDRGADPDVMNDKGSTALHWAIRYQHPTTVRLLFTKGSANPNIKRKLGLVAPIIIASAYGSIEICKMLVEYPDIDINLKIRGGETAVHTAAREGHWEIIQLLISKGAWFDEKDEVGDTPLLIAAKQGHVHVVSILLRHKADINARNYEGYDIWFYAIEVDSMALLNTVLNHSKTEGHMKRNPLCIAACQGRKDKIKHILTLNKEIPNADEDGNTFLHHAAKHDQFEVIEEFSDILPLESQNKAGNSPLHIACSRGFSRTVQTLLKCKAKADVPNTKGETPLHVAAYSHKITQDTVKILIEYTIKTHDWNSLSLKDRAGNNGLHMAAAFASPEVLWEFRPIKINERDLNGFTPLHKAVRPDKPDVLHMMLDIFESTKRDVSINEQSYSTGETTLHLAADAGHAKCIKRLVNLGADIQDINGDTVLHRIVKLCAHNEENISRHLEVYETIMLKVVHWWCIKHEITVPETNVERIQVKRQAVNFLTNDIHNNEGLSVIHQAFKSCVPQMLQRLLMHENVTMFEDKDCKFDVTGVTPRTTHFEKPSYCGGKVEPMKDIDDVDDKEHASGLELLIAHASKQHAAEVLDLPPVKLLEDHYRSVVAWTFSILMIAHLIYMSLYTFVGVELCRKLREDPDSINDSDAATVLMYIVVPIEPAVVIIYILYRSIMHFVRGDTRTLYTSKLANHPRVIRFLLRYDFMGVYLLFSVLSLVWIGLFTHRHKHQDYVLSSAICIGWLLSISFTRGIQALHFFYRMLISIIVRDIVRFIVVYLMVLLAFGFAFHILFQISGDIVSNYPTPGKTLFLTFNMMIGMGELFDGTFETNIEAAGRTPTFAKVLYLFYIVLSTIILLNLLIAMMNDSYSMILKENSTMWRVESVSMGVMVEDSFPIVGKFSKVKIHHGCLGTEAGTVDTSERFYVSMSEAEFDTRMLDFHKHQQAATDVVKRIDDLSTMIKQTNEKLQALTGTFQTLPKKKHKKRNNDEAVKQD